MSKCTERLYNGVAKENPTFVLMLGMCPTLAVIASTINGLGMGLSTIMVLLLSSMIISALREIISDKVRVPAYIVITASLIIMVQLLLQVYVPNLYSALGVYTPLIMINCIILGRAEPYASKNDPVISIFDGPGMGLRFTLVSTCIGLVREILGSGATFGNVVVPEDYRIAIFVLAPSAFSVLAILTALQNKLKASSVTNGSSSQFKLVCDGNHMSYTGFTCIANHRVLETRIRQAEERALAAKKTAVAKKEVELRSAASKKENQESGQMEELLLIVTDSALVNNVVLSQFLGLCPFLGVSRKAETSAGMGAAVIFVIAIVSTVTSLVHAGILVGLHLEYLQTIMFILVIAALVQLVEMFLKKSMPSPYEAPGMCLPLITTNCVVLGMAPASTQRSYSFIQSVVNGISISTGFTTAIITPAGICEKIEYNDVPYSFQGSPIVLIISGLMAIAFFGFSGLVQEEEKKNSYRYRTSGSGYRYP